jgi:putative acetyltransferase
MEIREEQRGEERAIAALIGAAFAGAAHSGGNEAAIVDALRRTDSLAVSLVAAEDGAIVGHVAFSPVATGGRTAGWFGLGPVAVRPERQRRGIGQSLIEAGLARLRAQGAKGCVVLGDPAYYRRFGFAADPAFQLAGVPPEYFLRLAFDSAARGGSVDYHPAFGVG